MGHLPHSLPQPFQAHSMERVCTLAPLSNNQASVLCLLPKCAKPPASFDPPPPSLLSPNLRYWNVLATRLRKIPPFITTCQAQQGHSPSHSPAALLIRPQCRHETSKIFCHRQKLVLICFKIRVSIKLNCASVERTFWALKGVPTFGAQFWL